MTSRISGAALAVSTPGYGCAAESLFKMCVGNFVGMYIEDHLALGTLIVRAIVPSGGDELMRKLHDAGYGVTGVNGEGANGPVKLVYTIVKRKHLKEVVNLIHASHPKAFLSVEDVRSTAEGIFPPALNDTNFLGRKLK